MAFSLLVWLDLTASYLLTKCSTYSTNRFWQSLFIVILLKVMRTSLPVSSLFPKE
ncbi:hypothetical protein SAMN05444349_1409 [Bacteroides faecichinchillae]|uniref:Uncharacterized protein n=1 Tax=Bacteroides faecichinchillae TaxID=871325 RepID=A0A1M5F0H7_9BACE|nr:hypothetical protein SAMN05444349_1409 [Bacteroides faecichinchillae]